MPSYKVTVVENNTKVTVSETEAVIAVTEQEVAVSTQVTGLQGATGAKGDQGEQGLQGEQGIQGIQGEQGLQGIKGDKGDTGDTGASGVISVTAPITNSGTSTSAQLGLDQTALAISPSQVTGTAVITTDQRLSDTRTTTNALTLGSGLTGSSFNGSTAVTATVDSTIPRLTATQTFTGAQTLVSSSAAEVPLKVQGAASQSASFLEVKNSGNSNMISVSSAGALQVSNRLTAGSFSVSGLGMFVVLPLSAATVGQVIRLAASQTADALQIQNSAGSNVLSVSPAGSLITAGRLLATTTDTGARLVLETGAAQVGATIRGASGQTADALQVQNNSATTLTAIKSTGEITAPQATLTATSASVVPLTVTGASGQTAALAEIKSSSGVANGFTVRDAGQFGRGAIISGTNAWVNNNVAAWTNLVLRGAASQTANLQEWQNSAGAVQASVSSSGNITALNSLIGGDVRVVGNVITMRSENSGGKIRFFKSTAAASNPGAGLLELYTRDGTTAGTLKLVVRAGASGAETTILDNIPQT